MTTAKLIIEYAGAFIFNAMVICSIIYNAALAKRGEVG